MFSLYVIISYFVNLENGRRLLKVPYIFLTDIDECKVENGGCQHTCINKRGSFRFVQNEILFHFTKQR